MMRFVTCLLMLVGLWCAASPASAAEPCPNGAPLAFDGAEGFGRCAQGGRGGVTVDVTNVNNSGAGSLRECAEVMSGPRTCRIMVAGTVSLGGYDIIIRHPYITIDGANYPMAIKDGGISVRASHTIIRHLRVRPGYYSVQARNVNSNGLSYMSNESGGQTTDHIADHVSISWTTDDSINVIYGTQRVTIQDSLIYEGLMSGGNCGICSSKGLLAGTGTHSPETVSVYRTLNAHNFLRFPQLTSGSMDFVNNVDYNSSGSSAQLVPYYQKIFPNMVNNYWKDGLSGDEWNGGLNLGYNVIRTMGQQTWSTQSGIYVAGNISVSRLGTETRPRHCNLSEPATCIIWGDNGGIPVVATRYPYDTVAHLMTAHEAYEAVLNHSGAWPRDPADARVVADVRNGTGRWISDPNTVGGWPVLTSGTTPPPPPTTPPPPPPASTYSLSAPASVAPTGSAAVTWTAPSDHSTHDWITFAPAGSGPQVFQTWAYVPAGTSGTVNITAPASAGSYELRYLLNNGYEQAAMTTITIGSSPPPPPAKQCADGLDNDSDGKVDLADPGCVDANDDSESPDPLTLEQRVAALEQALGTTQATLLALTDAHAATNVRVDGHDAAYASLASQLASLGAVVATIHTQIADLTTIGGTVNQSVTTHTASITSLQASVASIQSTLSAMCQALGGCL